MQTSPPSGFRGGNPATPLGFEGQEAFSLLPPSAIRATRALLRLTATFNGGKDTAVVRQRLVNISARARVAAGDNIAIVGFVIGGVEAKPVLIRAVGTPRERTSR